MSAVERKSPSKIRLFIVVTAGIILIGVAFFSALSASGFDPLAFLGLDSLLTGPGTLPARFQPAYALYRTIAIAVIAFGIPLLAIPVFIILILSIEDDSKPKKTTEKPESSQAATEQGGSISDDAVVAQQDDGVSKDAKAVSASKEAIPISPRDRVATDLDDVILRLQLRANVIYWTIIVNLLIGVILIIFAGYLSSFDTTYSNLNSQLQSDRAAIFADFARANTGAPPDAFSKYIQTKIEAVDKLQDNLMVAMTKQLEEKADSKAGINWSSTILRVGVIGMLVFLTQILVTLFRYNSRLIAFYRSRRDALLVADQDLGNLERLSEILYPENLDFGSEPRHPFQEFAELLRNAKGKKAPAAEFRNSTSSSSTRKRLSGNGTRPRGKRASAKNLKAQSPIVSEPAAG